MVVEWLWSGCGVVVEWLWSGCGVVVEWLWSGCGVVVEWLWSCCGVVVELLWSCCGVVVELLWSCCGVVVELLWSCCGVVVELLWSCCGDIPTFLPWYFLDRLKQQVFSMKLAVFAAPVRLYSFIMFIKCICSWIGDFFHISVVTLSCPLPLPFVACASASTIKFLLTGFPLFFYAPRISLSLCSILPGRPQTVCREISPRTVPQWRVSSEFCRVA